jgi:hypothetical protein
VATRELTALTVRQRRHDPRARGRVEDPAVPAVRDEGELAWGRGAATPRRWTSRAVPDYRTIESAMTTVAVHLNDGDVALL